MRTASPKKPHRRIVELDSLRALAAINLHLLGILVAAVVFHCIDQGKHSPVATAG